MTLAEMVKAEEKRKLYLHLLLVMMVVYTLDIRVMEIILMAVGLALLNIMTLLVLLIHYTSHL